METNTLARYMLAIFALSATGAAAAGDTAGTPALLSMAQAATQVADVDATDDEDELDVIIVTGTHLKISPAQVSKQVIVLTDDELRATGEPTLDRAIQRLPQAFGGMSMTNYANVNRGPGNDSPSFPGVAKNLRGAGTLNLRGLGPEGTLILVDGRRMGVSGIQGGIQDISSIPISAVDRVEILMDGASSIYGADAMAGAVNIILKKGAQDAEVTARYGQPFDGGTSVNQLSASWGGAWEGGRWFGTLEYRGENFLMGDEVDQLGRHQPAPTADTSWEEALGAGPNAEQTFFASSLLSAAGDASHGFGNVVFFAPQPDGTNFDPPYFGDYFTPGFAFPNAGVWTLASANPTSMEDFVNDGGSYAVTSHGTSVVPEQDEISVYFSAEQSLTDTVTLFGNVRVNDRTTTYANGHVAGTTTLIGQDDPRNPTGMTFAVAPHYVGLPAGTTETDSRDLATQLGLRWEISEDWSFEAGARYSRFETETVNRNVVDNLALANGDLWDPFNGGLNNYDSGPVTDPFGRTWDSIMDWAFYDSFVDADNRNSGFDLTVRGSLLTLPAGDVQVALRGEISALALETVHSTDQPSTGSASADSIRDRSQLAFLTAGSGILDGDRDGRALKAEVFVPVFSEANARPGLRELSLRLSSRYDKFEHSGFSYATPLNPDTTEITPYTGADGKDFSDDTYGVGLVWSPVERVRFKANVDTAFITPAIGEMFRESIFAAGTSTSSWERINDPDAERSISWRPTDGKLFGGNPDLQPETSTNLSFGIEVIPTENLFMSLHWSEIDYEGRLSQWDFGTIASAFGVREAARLYPTRVIVDETVPYDPTSTTFGRDGYLVAVDERVQNTNFVNIRNLDYRVRWDLESDIGTWSVDAAYTRALNYEEKDNDEPDTPWLDLKGVTVPKNSAALMLAWAKGNVFANVDANYRGRTHQLSTAINGTGWTYEDRWFANLRAGYNFDAGFLSGANLVVGIQNVLDTESKARFVHTDGTTGSVVPGVWSTRQVDPRGRQYYLQLTMAF